MNNNIDTSINLVNRLLYLTANNRAYRLRCMKYGERLRLARERAGLTQGTLAELVGMKQPSIAYLENLDNEASASEFTVKLARALKVSVDWLDDEIGEMIPVRYSTSDPKIVAMCLAMEPTPEYVKDAAVKAVLSTCELAARAIANGESGTQS